MRTTILILFVLHVLLPARLFAQKEIDSRAIGKDVVITGELGVPLGTVVEIDATIIAGHSLKRKELASKYLLRVTKVGSNLLPDPPTCRFQTHSWDNVKIASDTFSLYELRKGKKASSLSDSEIEELERDYVGQAYRLLVYEVGLFSGIPNDLPKDYAVWQDRGFGFRTHLIVLRITKEHGKPNQSLQRTAGSPAVAELYRYAED